MIQIIFTKMDGRSIGLTLTGHAGYDEKGQDIICAGVSAMVEAALNGLEYFGAEQFSYHVDPDGHLEIIIDNHVQSSIQVETIMKTLQLGLQAMQDDYPDYVNVLEKEVHRDD